MGAGYTPGPWWAEDDAVLAMLAGGATIEIARANVLQELRTDAEYANARLIASAPKLLEALVEAEKHFGPFSEITINGQHDPDDVRVVALIRAAIAKATGSRAHDRGDA